MRRIVIILTLLLYSAVSQATVRYVSTQADFDALSGITLVAGDQVLFERGKTFYGSLTIANSGALNNRITYGSYGSGANPIITGFTTVQAWTDLGGNIWESTSAVSMLSTVNVVSIGGVNTAMGKTPNSGYYAFQAHSGSTSITSSNLTGTPNWTGAEAVMRIGHFKWDRRVITSQSSGTINWTTATSYEPENNFGFFIQNDIRTLDAQNEWYYNPSTKKISVYSVGQPTSVKVASVDNILTIAASYLTIENISIEGANSRGITRDATTLRQDITIRNCAINFTGLSALIAPVCTNLLIDNNLVNNSNTHGISSSVYYNNTNVVISNNTIQNTATLIGMANSMWSALSGGNNVTMEYNRVINSGYDGISFYGNNITVRYNYVDTFCTNLDDGAGIYTYTGSQGSTTNGKVYSNIVINGIGASSTSAGTFPTIAAGIYMDEKTNDVEIYNNTIADCAEIGLFLNGNTNINAHNNTVYNGSAYQIKMAAWGSGIYAVNGNKFISKTSIQKSLFINSGTNDIPSKFVGNNNYYASPIGATDLFYVEQPSTGADRNYTLSQWKTFSSQDANSLGSPKTITDTLDLQFYYNDTKIAKTVLITQRSIDVDGTAYSGNVTLQPFTSLVLIKDVTTHNWYLSNTGNDSNDGLSPETPWQTIDKTINNNSIIAGDQILFKRGDTWREYWWLTTSGTPGNQITYSNYGTGAKPRILGSNKATTWTNQGGNVWKTDIAFPGTTQNVFFIKTDLSVATGVAKTSTGTLTAEFDWWKDANYVYVYAATNPATRYNSVEIPFVDPLITLNNKEYITIDGLDFFYGGVGIYESSSPSENVKGLIVRNCEIAYMGYPDGNGVGIHAFYSNSLFENNVIHDCGRRGISLIIVTNSFNIKNVVIQNNTFYNGYHTTSVDMQLTTGYTGSIDSIFIRKNLIYDDPNRAYVAYPMSMFLSRQANVGSTITNVFLEYNVFKYVAAPGIYFNGVNSAFMYNNTFYGHSTTHTGQQAFITSDGSTLKFRNNIFYDQQSSDASNKGLIYYQVSGQSIDSDYNIFYRTNKALKIAYVGDTYYSSNDSTAFRVKIGGEYHSKFVDPNVISPSNVSLTGNSKAINSGINAGLTTDFIGNLIKGIPDIGAYEYYFPSYLGRMFGQMNKQWKF